jgi:aminoglycoside 6'-N-acetyltransferase
MLVTWHDDPEVARYWDGERYSLEQMLARLTQLDVDAYIVEANGEPVGYLQAWFEGSRDGGLDMFLVPEARGRGLGSDAARTLARYLLARAGLERLTVDPYLSNERAVGMWAKAGFRPVEERQPDDEHPQPWLLMEFSSAS